MTTVSPAETALLRAILDDPRDDAARLIYADRLEEIGEEERAEFVRVQLALAGMEDCPTSEREPFSFILCRLGCERCTLRLREVELLEAPVTSRFDGDMNCAEGWSGGTRKSHWGIAAFKDLQKTGLLYKGNDGRRPLEWELRRGFVAAVTCTCRDWEAHGPRIVAAQPVETVVLADLRSAWHDREPGFPGWCDATRRISPWSFHAYYPTEEACRAAVQDAALRWARREAGLPPLG